MRSLTRAYLYPNDKRRVVQNASESPKQGWRAPNQKELLLLHFHANGFSSARPNGASSTNHYKLDGTYWYTSRTIHSYGNMRANRSWEAYNNSIWTANTSNVANSGGSPSTKNNGNWYLIRSGATSSLSRKYTYCILHGGTSFGLLYLDWYADGNPATISGGTNSTDSRVLRLVGVRDLK